MNLKSNVCFKNKKVKKKSAWGRLLNRGTYAWTAIIAHAEATVIITSTSIIDSYQKAKDKEDVINTLRKRISKGITRAERL